VQRQDKAYVASCPQYKDANMLRMQCKTKTQLKLICHICHFAYKIQQNFTI